MNKAYEIVNAFEELLKENPNDNLDEAWARLLGVPGQSPALMAAMSAIYANLMDLRFQIESDAELPERARALYINAIGSVVPLVSPMYLSGRRVANLTESRQQIDILHLAASYLPNELVPDVPVPMRDALSQAVTDLIGEIEASDIEASFKALLIAQLSMILTAITSYRVLGSAAATKIYGSAVAEFVRLSADPRVQSATAKSIVAKGIKLARTIGEMIVWANAAVSGVDGLIEHGSNILGLGDGPEAPSPPK
jgi:hypothetical protein